MSDSNVSPRMSDGLLFDVKPLDRALIDLIPALRTPGRWAALNAIRHLNRSFKIKEHDPEIAIFRALCAEEEAAAALILSIKGRQYENSGDLRHRHHIDKNSVIPFFDALSRVVSRLNPLESFHVLLNTESEPHRLYIRFLIPEVGESGVWASPQPPLNFVLTRSRNGVDLAEKLFLDGLEEICHDPEKGLPAQLIERANARNRLLYASNDGYPMFGGDVEKTLGNFQRNVLTILRIINLVDPYERQSFMQQAVTEFARLVKTVRGRKEIVFD